MQRETNLIALGENLMNLGKNSVALGSLLLGASLVTTMFVEGPLVSTRLFPAVAPHSHWTSTWNEIRLTPLWWLPVLVAFAASWILMYLVHTRRKSLLVWSPRLQMVSLVGFAVGYVYVGLNLLVNWNYLGFSYWCALAALLSAAVGSFAMSVGVYTARDTPWLRA